MKKILLVLLVLAILGGLGAGVYFKIVNKKIAIENKAEDIKVVENKNDEVVVSSPLANSDVYSGFKIEGKARGNWFFEASFPIKLLRADGTVLAQAIAAATGDWMTTEFVPFSTVLKFDISSDEEGTLVFQKDNPSGLPENDKQIVIPVHLRKN